jgi:hypothetical protein
MSSFINHRKKTSLGILERFMISPVHENMPCLNKLFSAMKYRKLHYAKQLVVFKRCLWKAKWAD